MIDPRHSTIVIHDFMMAIKVQNTISLSSFTKLRSLATQSLKAIFAVLLLGILSACIQNPLAPYEANDAFLIQNQRGAAFNHKLVFKSSDAPVDSALHIYIEGDGRPWWRPKQVALDPTPKRPLMLTLMEMDNAPALYIGRPCYFQVSDASCNPYWWTDKRYAAEVVESINAIIDRYVDDYPSVILMGHSGGGALAALIASVRNDVTALITLAANLDINAWATHHGYTTLTGSLNPADINKLDAGIKQSHFVGSEDTQVPAQLIAPVVEQQWGQRLKTVDGFDHNCCWQEIWPSILEQHP